MSAAEDDSKLRAQLNAAKRKNGTLWVAVWFLFFVSCGLGGLSAYLFIKRDQPLVAFTEEVRTGVDDRELAASEVVAADDETPAIALPEDSVVALDKRDRIIQTLEVFARQDGIFSPCFPGAYNNSQIPLVVADWLRQAGFSDDEMLFMNARYEQVWQQHFRQTASALPGDSARRVSNCQRMSEEYLRTDSGQLGLDTPDRVVAYMRQIMTF